MHNCHTHSDCIETALDTAKTICDGEGLRFTPIRRAVLELVWASHGPIKAYDILGQLDSSLGSITPPTVYRALDFLLENGLVHKLNSLNAYVGCSHPHQHSECYFLICSDCGEAMECCNKGLVDAIAKTGRQNNFKPKYITLEINGECGDCQGRH